MKGILLTLLFSYLLSVSYSLTPEQIDKAKSKFEQRRNILTPTLKATGQSQNAIRTDIVKVNFEVRTKDVLATKALQDNNQISEAVFKAIQDLGIKKEDIHTSDFSVTPQTDYKWNAEKQANEITFQGYQVSNRVEVELKDLDSAAASIDAAMKASQEVQINSVAFDVSPDIRQKAEDELIDAAIKDAQNKAQIALTGTGYLVTGIKSIDLNAGAARYPPPMPRASMAADSKVVLFGNKQTISMSALVEFYIEQQ
jgi:uncharacterized protein YggE